MLFGQETSPRIYAWGNPGAAAGSASQNSTLAAGRVTEGGTFSRAYVPMHDASTTDPVVQQYRIDDLDRKSSFYFKSLDVVQDLTSARGIDAVIAIDEAGRMWTWGKDKSNILIQELDATGLGGVRITNAVAGCIHRPHRVLTPSERESGVTRTWSKVQSSDATTVAMTDEGQLLATGADLRSVQLDRRETAILSSTYFQPISTQTWSSFCFGKEGLFAVRNDGKLFQKRSDTDRSLPAEPVEGLVAEAYLVGGRFYIGTTGYTASFTSQAAPAGGTRIGVQPLFNTATGEVRPYVFRPGLRYTSAPSVTMSISRHSSVPEITPPTVVAELVPDDKWVEVACNKRGEALAVSQKTVFLRTNANSTLRDSIPDGGFVRNFSGVGFAGIFINLYRPFGNSSDVVHNLDLALAVTSATASYVAVTAVCDCQSFGDTATAATGSNFAIRFENPLSSPGDGKTNLLVWGANQCGLLATGSTSPQREIVVAGAGKPDSGDWVFDSFAIGGLHSAGVKSEWPSGVASDLVIAGKHQFAGNSAATANHVSFAYPTPSSANGFQNDESAPDKNIKWKTVFCWGREDTGEQLTIACRG